MVISDHLEAYGKAIKQLRKFRQMTQQQLADAAELRMPTISDIEAGKANFNINTLIRISAALKCEIEITFTPLKMKAYFRAGRKDFIVVLQENLQAQISGYYNVDKTDLEKEKRNAVIEEYKDLIAIYKALNE